jgi:Ca2+-binding RTX toxin-like protein
MPLFEPLESRQLLSGHGLGGGHHVMGRSVKGSADIAMNNNGVVSYTGGAGIDWMFVSADATSVTVQVNGVDHMYDRSKVKGINLNGAGGDDTILVFDTDNSFNIPVTMTGGAGNDDLEGGSEKDYLDGGAGNDYMFGNGGDDVMLGGDGNDIMNAGDGNDIMRGGYGDDQLGGGEGNDYLYGNAGNDILLGEGGDDHLSGGRGTDMVQGDDGVDTFSSRADTDAERIMDGMDVLVTRFPRPVM